MKIGNEKRRRFQLRRITYSTPAVTNNSLTAEKTLNAGTCIGASFELRAEPFRDVSNRKPCWAEARGRVKSPERRSNGVGPDGFRERRSGLRQARDRCFPG